MRPTDPLFAEPLAGLVRRLAGATGATVAMIYTLPPGETFLELVALYGSSQQIAAPWARVGLREVAPAADAFRDKAIVWVEGPGELAHRYPRIALLAPYEIRLAAAPLTDDGVPVGVVSLMWPAWHAPRLTADERDAVDAFGESAGALLGEMNRKGDPLGDAPAPLLLRPSRTDTPEPDESLAAWDFAERLPTGCCALDLDGRVTFLNSAGRDLLGVKAGEMSGERPWDVVPWLGATSFEHGYRTAVISRMPVTFTAARDRDQRLAFDLQPGMAGISVSITPVARDEEVSRTGIEPPPAPGPLRAPSLYHLLHLAASLTEAVGVDDVVEQAADHLIPAFAARGMVLMTIDSGRLHVVGHRGYAAEFMARIDGQPLSADAPPARTLNSATPLFYGTYEELRSSYPDAPRQEGREAWAFLPLITSGRPVGLLVLSYDEPRRFPGPERTVLTSLAGLIAQALDRARLYDAKHQLARTLQAGLLPRELPAVTGLDVAAYYLPAGHGTDVGGDFYDVVRCGRRCVSVAIGDVQGHNEQAAALMGQVRTAVHTHAAAHASPGEVLAQTNRFLADINSGLFASCLYAHLDLARGSALLSTAGHPPPLIRTPSGRARVLPMAPGLLLGIALGGSYPTVETAVPAGTALVLYTDGLVEAPGTDIEETMADLADCLGRTGDLEADALADALLDHALHTTPHTDDSALLVVRVTGEPV